MELADWKFMHPRSRCLLVQGRLSKLSLKDQEQDDSSHCEGLKKLHDPLGPSCSRDARSRNAAFDL